MSETVIPYTVVDSYRTPGRLDLDRAHADDAAVDLRAATEVYLEPGERKLVKTGIHIAIPGGYAGLILPRSGVALRQGVTVLNAPGLIDPGYRGEIGVILHRPIEMSDIHANADHPWDAVWFDVGDRIAQLLVIRTADVGFCFHSPENWKIGWGESKRGEGGFGSTGR